MMLARILLSGAHQNSSQILLAFSHTEEGYAM